MKINLFRLVILLLVLGYSAPAHAWEMRHFKRPITISGFSWLGDHTYMCLDGNSGCYGYNADGNIYTSGATVTGGNIVGYKLSPTSSQVLNSSCKLNCNMGPYGIYGVCHQHTNRGLNTFGQTVSSLTVGYTKSKSMFGTYGINWSSCSCVMSGLTTASKLESASVMDDNSLHGKNNKVIAEARHEFYTRKTEQLYKMAVEKYSTAELKQKNDEILSDDFSLMFDEILGDDYDASKKHKVIALQKQLLSKNSAVRKQYEKSIITESDASAQISKNAEKFLADAKDILGEEDYNMLFEAKLTE